MGNMSVVINVIKVSEIWFLSERKHNVVFFFSESFNFLTNLTPRPTQTLTSNRTPSVTSTILF